MARRLLTTDGSLLFKVGASLRRQEDGKLKASEEGRLSTKGEAEKRVALGRVIRRIPAYLAIVERAAHRREDAVSVSDVSAHWHTHFKEEAGGSDEFLKMQAISFFQITEGARLGTMIIGRRGQPTRFSFSGDALKNFVGGAQAEEVTRTEEEAGLDPELGEAGALESDQSATRAASAAEAFPARRTGQGIFVAHGKNKKPLDN